MQSVQLTKPPRNQLCFEFADTDKATSPPKTKKQSRPAAPTAAAPSSPLLDNGLADLCMLLYAIARKNVAPTNFSDFCMLARCTKLLQELGLPIAPSSEMTAHVADTSVALVTSAPEYRLLRSRAIAGLATIADLATKPPAKGKADYQRGMRAGYRQASDIAAMFLDDLEQFQFPKRAR